MRGIREGQWSTITRDGTNDKCVLHQGNHASCLLTFAAARFDMIQPRFKLFMEHWLSESVEFFSASDFGPLDKAWATTADQRNCSDNFQHCTVLLLNRAQQMEQKNSTSTCKHGSHTFFPQSSNQYATAKVAKSSTQLLDISRHLLSRMHQFLAQCQQLRPETLHFTALFLHGKNWVASLSKESFWKFTLPGWYLENADPSKCENLETSRSF